MLYRLFIAMFIISTYVNAADSPYDFYLSFENNYSHGERNATHASWSNTFIFWKGEVLSRLIPTACHLCYD